MATPFQRASQWYDHGGLGDPEFGHSTDGGRVFGVTKAVYAECERYGCTPVLVIAPEDREQVKRLADALMRRPGDPSDWSTMLSPSPEMISAALRSLIAQPKPDEPTGLGAVVEDSDGKRYIRTADTDCALPWSYANNFTDMDWAGIDAVKILSEGVQ